jgi:hypothetical protein
MTTQENNDITFKDRLCVHLAFALQDQEDISIECLSSADFKRLIEGKVSKKEEDIMWRHIDACEDCFEEWMALPSPRKKQSFVKNIQNVAWDISDYVSDILRQLFIPRYGIPAFAVVMSCFFIIYFQFFRDVSVNQLLNNAYQVAVQTKIQKEFLLPWEEQQQKALIGPDLITITQKAFSLGLSHGRDQLKQVSQTTHFSEHERNAIVNQNDLKCFYYSAKWLILIQSYQLMDNEYSEQFWNEQLELINTLIEMIELSDKPPQELQELCDRLSQIRDLWPLKDRVGKMRWQHKVGKLCHVVIEQFSPKYIPEEKK